MSLAESDILQKIIATKLTEIDDKSRKVSLSQLEAQLEQAPPIRDFSTEIREKLAQREPVVIAEIKKASPSAGVLRDPFKPAEIAKTYAKHGATCLSVLTDQTYFQGHDDYLIQVKKACQLPILRKDFIINPYQVYESRILGADCILLIVAALPLAQLKSLEQLAYKLGMAVLVESHTEAELESALQLTTPLIGINNRDLKTFKTDLNNSITLKKSIPNDRITISESGLQTAEDIQLLQQNGINTFLIGGHFMQEEDPGLALKALLNSRTQ